MKQRNHQPPSRSPSAARSECQADARWRRWLPGLTLVAIVTLCYLPALWGSYVMDDNYYVTDQPVNWSLDGLRRIWLEPRSTPQYYPLLHTSFWLQYQLWQDSPLGYHAVNLLLFACTVVLAWRVLLRLQVPGAWLAAAIFAVHPVCVESVAWVTKLMNLQSMLLALGAMWCYLRFEPPALSDASASRSAGWPYYVFALVLFLLALLSKTVVASLPAVLLVLYWWKRGTLGWRDVRPLAPFFVLGIAFGLMTAWLERYHAGAEGADWSLTLVERCLVAGRAVWFYAGKLVWPYPLLFYYPRWTIDPAVWWQWLYPLGVVAVVAALWLLRARMGRGPLAAVLIYVGVLFPALGFFNVYAFRYSYVTDHWQYHAMLALIALAAAGWSLWCQQARGAIRATAVAAAVIVIAVFVPITWQQAQLYVNPAELYQAALLKNPESWVGHNNLGQILVGADKKEEAIACFERSLAINPENEFALYNYGLVLVKSGRLQESTKYFEQAVRLKTQLAEAYCMLGDVKMEIGSLQEAIENYRKGLRIKPELADARTHLAEALLQAGRPAEAVEQYQKALQIKPDYPELHNNLANALLQLGQPEESLDHYQQALRLKPDFIDAHNNLANLFKVTGQVPQAIEHYQQALRLKPDSPEIEVNLGITLKQAGRLEEAVEHYQQALRLKPDYPEAHSNLGNALVLLGRTPEAIDHYQQSLRLRSDAPWVYANLGRALVTAGRTQEAIGNFEKALQLKADMPDVAFDLAQAYAQVNRSAEAVATAQKALDLARASGQISMVQQVETWLNSYRERLSSSSDAGLNSNSAVPKP